MLHIFKTHRARVKLRLLDLLTQSWSAEDYQLRLADLTIPAQNAGNKPQYNEQSICYERLTLVGGVTRFVMSVSACQGSTMQVSPSETYDTDPGPVASPAIMCYDVCSKVPTVTLSAISGAAGLLSLLLGPLMY